MPRRRIDPAAMCTNARGPRSRQGWTDRDNAPLIFSIRVKSRQTDMAQKQAPHSLRSATPRTPLQPNLSAPSTPHFRRQPSPTKAARTRVRGTPFRFSGCRPWPPHALHLRRRAEKPCRNPRRMGCRSWKSQFPRRGRHGLARASMHSPASQNKREDSAAAAADEVRLPTMAAGFAQPASDAVHGSTGKEVHVCLCMRAARNIPKYVG